MPVAKNMNTACYEGLRVIRGKDWCWGDQDGGDGGVGTVIRGEKSSNNLNTAVVLWDNGYISNYRTGQDGKYDLLVYDSGPAGINHGVLCTNCVKKLWGMKWDCTVCPSVHLCGVCYVSGAHDVDHHFTRNDHPNSPKGKELPARCDSVRTDLKGIFVNSRVRRGKHWQWGNQDGCGNLGTVWEISDSSGKSGRSVAKVQWDGGAENIYRLGHLGKVDLALGSCPWGEHFCYKEHLPNLCPSYINQLNPVSNTGRNDPIGQNLMDADKPPDVAASPKLVGNDVNTLEDETFDINKQDERGDTFLHAAIRNGDDGDVMSILSNNSLIPSISNFSDEDGLQLAAKFGNTFAIERILERWPNMARRERRNDSALHLSCIHGNLEATRCLVEKGGASVNTASPLGFSPLHLAIDNGHADVALFLVDKGANLNWAPPTGDGCVKLAIYKIGKLEVDKDCSGEISEIAREIGPNILNCYPGLPLACLLARRGAPYKDQNLPQNILQVLSEQSQGGGVVKVKTADVHLCVICEESKLEVVFQCGHTSCKKCSLGLRDCHMCKTPIVQKINLFL